MAWCAGFLLLAQFAFASCELDAVNRPRLASTAAALRAAEGGDVRVLAFGSSRMWSAFDSELWDRLAGRASGSTLNLSINSGRISDALHMVRFAGGVPDGTEMVLIETPYWSFNRGWRNPISKQRAATPPQLRQWGTLADRLTIDDPLERARLVGDWFWPLYQRRDPVAWLQRIRGPWSLTPKVPPPHPLWQPKNRRRGKANIPFEPQNIARDHFFEPTLSQLELRSLDRLLERLRASSARVVLVRLPATPAYLETARSDPAGRAFSDRVDREVAASAGDRATIFACDTPSACGLPGDIFVDYGHMTHRGARLYTRHLFEALAGGDLTLGERLP